MSSGLYEIHPERDCPEAYKRKVAILSKNQKFSQTTLDNGDELIIDYQGGKPKASDMIAGKNIARMTAKKSEAADRLRAKFEKRKAEKN